MASKRSKGTKTLTSSSPSKRPKKSNLSAPMSCSSSSSSHQPTPNDTLKRTRGTASPSTSSESSHACMSPHSAALETVSDSTSHHQGGYDVLKLLKAVAEFRLRNGTVPTMLRYMPYFLKEVKDFVPKGLTEKQLIHKLRSLREKFQKNPSPGPNCAEFDRSLYELGVKAWGSRRLGAKRNVNGSVKRNGKDFGMKNKRKVDELSENEEEDHTHWEAEKSMELGNDKEDELLEEGCINLPDKDEADSLYKYLKHALEDFWIAKNLDLYVLQLALQKVDSVQAKRLDEKFMEIAKDELKLKIEKNRLSNDIINVLCTGMKRW